MKNRSIIAILTALSMLTIPKLALAVEDGSGHFYVGGSTGYMRPDTDRFGGAGFLGGNTRTAGLQLGYQFSDAWSVEVGHTRDFWSPGDYDLKMNHLQLVRHWGTDVRFLVEFGFTHVGIDNGIPGTDDSTLGNHLGAGLSAFLTDNLELRGDAKIIYSQNDKLTDGVGTLSLNYHFGRTHAAYEEDKPVLGSSYQTLPPIQQREPVEPVAPAVPVPRVTHTLVNFAHDSSELESQYGEQLDEISSEIVRTDSRAVVEGHTDSDGSDMYNKTLSMDRAIVVKRALKGRGVPGEDMQVVGYGEDRPIATNETDEGKAQNRRVEVKLFDK